MNNIQRILKTNWPVILALGVIFAIAVILRNYTLSDNLLFGMEQGRDALKVRGIYELKDIVLIGPKTDIDGLFHGVWYYYLLAFIYWTVGGNPMFAATALTFIGSFTCVVVYFIARELDIRKSISLLASLLVAVSYNPIIYSRWLSNVSPSILIASLFFLSILMLLKRKDEKYWIPVFASFALLFHFELLHGLYALVVLLILIPKYAIKLGGRHFLRGSLLFFLIQLPFIVFELKNSFILSKGILKYLTHSNLTSNPFETLSIYIRGFLDETYLTFAAKSGLVPILFIAVMLYLFFKHYRTQKHPYIDVLFFLLIWTFPYMFLLRDGALHQFYAGTSIFMIVCFVYLFSHTIAYMRPVFAWGSVAIIVLLMIGYTIPGLRERRTTFYHGIQREMTLQTQLAMIDYMYAQNRPFQWEAFTLPYYYSDAYKYLIPWYGKEKYPNTYEKLMQGDSKTYYLIVEPATEGYWLGQWFLEKDRFSKVISEKQFGSLRLIERTVTK